MFHVTDSVVLPGLINAGNSPVPQAFLLLKGSKGWEPRVSKPRSNSIAVYALPLTLLDELLPSLCTAVAGATMNTCDIFVVFNCLGVITATGSAGLRGLNLS